MRSMDEIVVEICRLNSGSEDFFGTRRNDLMEFLDFDHAKQFLKEEVTREKWSEICRPMTREAVIAMVRDYLSFAWDKANGCRGLSAMRSLDHFAAWFWLLGEEEFAKGFDGYTHYGKPQLVAISEYEGVGFPWREHDNGEWLNSEEESPVSAVDVLGDAVGDGQ